MVATKKRLTLAQWIALEEMRHGHQVVEGSGPIAAHEALRAKGLAVRGGNVQTGDKVRRTYAITEAGKAELGRLVEQGRRC